MTDELERRVAALEEAFAALTRPDRSDPADPAAEDDRFWLLQQVRDRHPDGAVVFGGTATLPEGDVAWQWGVPSEQVLEQDWEAASGVFGALAHPVRLQLLQQVLNGTTSTAELGEGEALGTTGQLHHHLRALVAGGWLTSTGRGRWSVPGPRIIPLLVMITAAATN